MSYEFMGGGTPDYGAIEQVLGTPLTFLHLNEICSLKHLVSSCHPWLMHFASGQSVHTGVNLNNGMAQMEKRSAGTRGKSRRKTGGGSEESFLSEMGLGRKHKKNTACCVCFFVVMTAAVRRSEWPMIILLLAPW